MKIESRLLKILEEQNVLKTSKTKPLVDAIVQRNPITFYYSGPRKGKESVKPGTRVNAEAVALGLSKKGNLIVRAYVPSPNVSKKGFNKTNWRTFMVSRMSNVKIDDTKNFDLNRPQYKEGDDDLMSVTYVTSDKTFTPKTKKIEKPTTEPTKKVKPIKVEPQVKPEKPQQKIEPTEPKTVEPTPQELPQPKPVTKPAPPKEDPLAVEPPKEEPTTQELPEPTEKENPDETPEVDKLQESIKRIKHLML